MTEKLQGQLYDLTLKTLIKRLEGGTATAADLSVARQFLKDMNFSPSEPNNDSGLQRLNQHMTHELEQEDAYGDDPVLN